MSKITAALEVAVADLLALRLPEGVHGNGRQRVAADRAFVRLLRLLAPRFRHFIRQYGLAHCWEDAEQCCAIAVHRAAAGYDPDKAQFTTFVNWQIRGELQSLRFRLMTDQRPSAQKVGATTVSLQAAVAGPDGETLSLEALIEDEEALARTQSAASDYLARAATQCLIEEFVAKGRHAALEGLRRRSPKRAAAGAGSAIAEGMAAIDARLARDRDIIERRVFGELADFEPPAEDGLTREQARQIGKRATRTIALIAKTDPRYRIMTEASTPPRLAA